MIPVTRNSSKVIKGNWYIPTQFIFSVSAKNEACLSLKRSIKLPNL
ncbi:MAG: hypothetical protein ACD_32C00074G0003 [uncultured bacterium]|nr:MAG: hypothetical protein ACD_32C00074G0003 [uncultured bacterium]